MQYELKLRELLLEMRKRTGTISRLADKIAVSDRAVSEWLGKSEHELRLRQDHVDKILLVARELGLEPELFAPAPPLWDFGLPYEANLASDIGMPPKLEAPFRKHRTSFLGHSLNSPFGASASVLTCTASRIRFLAHAGSDVTTAKTVRATKHRAHPSPNILCCTQEIQMLDPAQRNLPPIMVGNPADGPQFCTPAFGLMNRFGMPCPPPEVWQRDFLTAKESLVPGQLLILSVVGTAERTDPPSVLVSAFVKVVDMAVKLGAEVIELNCSCPNCNGKEGQLYQNLSLVLEILKEIAPVARDAQIVLKIGYLKGRKLHEFVVETAPYVHAIAAINTLPVEGLRQGVDGPVPAFGAPGVKAGLSGAPILRCALSCVQELASIRNAERLNRLGIIGIGGITTPQDVLMFLNSGADVVQATTAFFSDSYFGIKVRRVLDSELCSRELTSEEEEEIADLNWKRALRDVEAGLGGSEPLRKLVREVAIADILEWERQHTESVRLGVRRPVAVPTRQQFAERIRARLAKSKEPRN
jgi:dihydroorotate dehydrogenase (NAD+) catalytic subunit